MSSKRSKAAKQKSPPAKNPWPAAGASAKRAKTGSGGGGAATANRNDNNNHHPGSGSDLPSAGYLISCDVPTKQFIQYLNELKAVDKKFILQDLDSTHLLVKLACQAEIERRVEDWLDENVFSAIEKVGEDLDMS